MNQLTMQTFDAQSMPGTDIPEFWNCDAPVLMCATDDNYVMPLAAALTSVAANLSQDYGSAPLQLVLLDGGISPDNWNRLALTLSQHSIRTLRVTANRSAVDHLNISHHISHTAYFRLLSSQWLPQWISRVIYLDCDTITLSDIRELWFKSLHDTSGNEVWAVPDIACPFMDASVGCEQFRKMGPYLAALTPVPNYAELSITPGNLYFNSGVMVIDLAAWRKHQRSQELLRCLEENQQHVWCWDQYALNVVFAEKWGMLPLAWNFGAHAFDYPLEKSGLPQAPLLPDQFQQMLAEPKIMHFTTEIKPWHYYCFHPNKNKFFEYLDKTDWNGWRPTKPNLSIWWHVQSFKLQKRIMAASRRWNGIKN
jgi:lipopolysaccharide biosynthesis glycosyltransferase